MKDCCPSGTSSSAKIASAGHSGTAQRTVDALVRIDDQEVGDPRKQSTGQTSTQSVIFALDTVFGNDVGHGGGTHRVRIKAVTIAYRRYARRAAGLRPRSGLAEAAALHGRLQTCLFRHHLGCIALIRIVECAGKLLQTGGETAIAPDRLLQDARTDADIQHRIENDRSSAPAGNLSECDGRASPASKPCAPMTLFREQVEARLDGNHRLISRGRADSPTGSLMRQRSSSGPIETR